MIPTVSGGGSELRKQGSVLEIQGSIRQGVQKRLVKELEKLKRILNIGYNLNVKWVPTSKSNLSGEVRGSIIYIYENAEDVALETLKHEFVDYCVSQAIEPYKDVTNRLIKMINEDAYKRKEKVVEALTRLLIVKSDNSGHQ